MNNGLVLIADPQITRIPVVDCGEPLVDLAAWLLVGNRRSDPAAAHAYARASVAQRLRHAETHLPDGVRLLIIEAFRPIVKQRAIFDGYLEQLRLLHPDWDASTLTRAASRFVAPAEFAPHTAGAAVDLTLCDYDGLEIDMGSPESATPEETGGRCYTDSPDIDDTARGFRAVLGTALRAVGMVNYPTEWWHWSYGDRYWAFVTGQSHARYAACADPMRNSNASNTTLPAWSGGLDPTPGQDRSFESEH
jgi:D-alanyl-D-alanine dipeptidase